MHGCWKWVREKLKLMKVLLYHSPTLSLLTEYHCWSAVEVLLSTAEMSSAVEYYRDTAEQL